MINKFFITLLVILGFGLTVTLSLGIGAAIDGYGCKQYHNVTGRQTRYDMFAGGCFVKTDKGWFPRDRVGDLAE